MRAACFRLGQLVNQTELARDVALAQPTVHRYLNLLETSFLLVRVPAYAVNRTKRLIKTPKLYWGDVGLALHLAGLSEPTGAHLENLVLHDLLCWRDARVERAELLYWRTATGEEVDFVVEAGRRLLPIEVKATPRPRLRDAAPLRAFRTEYGKAARSGLLLHTGSTVEWLASDVLAVPWWRVC
jgi:predicted AAA+ superfamily ATPase